MTRTRFSSLVAVLLCVLSAAEVFAQSGGVPDVRILDAGAEPRRELRYQFREGTTESVAMDMNIGMRMSMGGFEIPQLGVPTIRMIIDLGGAEVSDDGTARYQFEIGSIEIVDSADSDPAMAAAIRQALGQMPSISGWARIDSRGATLDGGIEIAGGVDSQLSQVFDSAEQSLQQMSAPFPREPVGVGAQWEVVQDMESGGFNVSQTATYSLREMSGNNIVLDVSMAQSAPAQVVELPGMPPGTGANLESLEANGTGTMRVDLSRFTPSSDMSMDMAMILGVAAQGGSQQISMNMQTVMSIAPVD